MKRILILLLWPALLIAQSKTGELRLRITDPAGLGVKSSVELVSEANQFRQIFVTDDSGVLEAQRLPFGLYRLQVTRDGFAPVSQALEIRSAAPKQLTIKLSIAGANETVTVSDKDTLIDPERVGNVNDIGSQTIQDRETALPGRSLQALVNSQPGWLLESNAVPHPRGSEYQTQFVVNGIPLTDNRSPGKGPEIEADNVESMSIYTAGIPAEYGRKLGGIVEVNTQRDTRQGFHGDIVLSGGSFDTAGGYTMLQYLAGKNLFGVSANGSMTSWYLNPPVPQNYTNTGTLGDFAGTYQREFTPSDRLTLTYRHALVRYQVPNEQLQQAAGQRQDGDLFEDLGTISFQHIFSSDVLADLHGMVRSNSGGLSSNSLSTPIIVSQANHFTEGYFNGSIAIHRGRHEWKAGVESDNTFLHESFADVITNPAFFDPGTPATFSFVGNRPDLEQSAYVQDLIRLGNWTVSAGLRWDHYQLLVNQNAFSPRLGLSRYFRSADLLVHAAYDRVFQTPASENILLASSPTVVVLNPDVLRLPIEPSHGNYYELGLTKGFLGKFSVDANTYLRQMNNFADDDLLLNTPIAFPVAFRRASIYGAEGKVNVPHWGKLSGFVGYSYMVGSAYFPATGGLFLGESATNAQTQLTGRFWVSQDQRNTVRTRFRYQFIPRLWGAVGAQYGSGLPVDFDGTYEQALAQYGPTVISKVNLDTGRVKPSFSLDTSVGADLWSKDNVSTRLQFDVLNLTDRFNLINFAGLFSGNSVAPPRTFGVRLQTSW